MTRANRLALISGSSADAAIGMKPLPALVLAGAVVVLLHGCDTDSVTEPAQDASVGAGPVAQADLDCGWRGNTVQHTTARSLGLSGHLAGEGRGRQLRLQVRLDGEG